MSQSSITAANNQHILFGSAYYHEYMPEHRLETDLDWMQEAGFNVIRVGESTWTDWEPREGQFCEGWMRDILDAAHARNIKVILGFPTYSIPPWLHRLHPDIVVNRQLPECKPIGPERMPTYPILGPPGAYGPRQNQDYCHSEFLKYAARITGWIMDAFAAHPAVIAYQVDNETIPSRVASPHAVKKFRAYLQEKYPSHQELNNRFVLAFWGQKLSSWEDLPSPEGLINPGLRLEWDRFQRRTVTDYLAMLVDIVRQKKRPEQHIIHDFIGGFLPQVDQPSVASLLDVVAANIYYPTQEVMLAEPIWLAADVARSLKRKNFWVTESNAQSIGWDSRTQHPPYPGQLRLAALAQIAAGADMVSYWHWASLHNGQETFWRGVLGHDLQKNRIYHEVREIGSLLAKIGHLLAGQSVHSDVALLYSADSCSALHAMPFSDTHNYSSIVRELYSHLHLLGVQTDFLFDNIPDAEKYRVIIVPPLYVASDNLLRQICDFVECGGHALVLFKSGFCDEFCTVRRSQQPGLLYRAAGVHYQEFSNLAASVPLRAPDHSPLRGALAHLWAEFLVPESAQVLASLNHEHFAHPVVTRNNYGQGFLTYQATMLETSAQRRLLEDVLSRAGVALPGKNLPEHIHLRHTIAADGRHLRYYFNFSGQPCDVQNQFEDGFDLISEKTICHGQNISLLAWDCAVLRQ